VVLASLGSGPRLAAFRASVQPGCDLRLSIN